MVLRRLHEPDGRIGERRHEVFEPVGRDDIVGIEHADDLRLWRGMLERKPERSRLEALELVRAHELEARAEQPAMLLDRPPKGGVGRVVDHQHAFEIRPIELGHAVERLAQHFRRLAAGGDMDRDERRMFGRRACPHEQAQRLRPEHDGGELFDPPPLIMMSGMRSTPPTNMAICEPSTK